ncbi:hypothetical protein C0583_05570 [Candidatus Parcubacteria bacterium]|nr:MAG: hypothetical protein C0583_05570 [Candidatus Parcubacteria bacterium]
MKNKNEKNEPLVETSTSSAFSVNADNEIIDYSQSPELQEMFNCDQGKLKTAATSAFEKILSRAESNSDKQHLKNLIAESGKYMSEKSKSRENEFIHGTGTDALFGIIEQGKIIRRGAEFGGADVEMGHKIDKTESGERETYISVSENQPMGMGLSYIYARGFARPETIDKLSIDANQINQSNSALEQWDALPKEEQLRLQKDYGFSRELIEGVSERPHYFEPPIEENKIFVYQSVLDNLKNKNIPKAPDEMTKVKEVHHLYGKTTNIEIIEKIMTNIASEFKKWPNTDINDLIATYEDKLKRTQSRLQQYNNLTPEEQKRKTHQLPVILTIKKEGIQNVRETKKVQGKELPIHPSEQERRIYGDIDITNISEIQVPENIITEVKAKIEEKIKQTNDPMIVEHLKNIKLLPLEFYEIERVVQKQVNELQ